jgi:hypothetical protein
MYQSKEQKMKDMGSSEQEESKTKKIAPQLKTQEETMNLHSFVILKKYSIAIEHRIQSQTNNDQSEKTVKAWEEIYSQTMNRITK